MLGPREVEARRDELLGAQDPAALAAVPGASVLAAGRALVGETEGWVAAPPGTRKSTYDNPEYQKAAPFAQVVYESVANADITKPTKDPVPYVGIQYVAIPEFQGIGTTVGQQIAAALAGQVTVYQALETAQAAAERTMKQAGYIR